MGIMAVRVIISSGRRQVNLAVGTLGLKAGHLCGKWVEQRNDFVSLSFRFLYFIK